MVTYAGNRYVLYSTLSSWSGTAEYPGPACWVATASRHWSGVALGLAATQAATFWPRLSPITSGGAPGAFAVVIWSASCVAYNPAVP